MASTETIEQVKERIEERVRRLRQMRPTIG